MVERIVGSLDGVHDETLVGLCVGDLMMGVELDGTREGCPDRDTVGRTVGSADGIVDGAMVVSVGVQLDGTREGCSVGVTDGETVSNADGIVEGEVVGPCDGDPIVGVQLNGTREGCSVDAKVGDTEGRTYDVGEIVRH